MKFSVALETIGKAWVPGVIDYYAKMNPDPWQDAHDRVEKAMLLKDPEILEIATQVFCEKCLELIEKFKKEGQPSKGVTIGDAFMMGMAGKTDEEIERKREQWERVKRSLRLKECYRCSTKENLVPVTHPDVENYTFLACRACKAKYRLK